MGCYDLLQGNLPDPGIEPVSLVSPALAGGFFTSSPTSEAPLFDIRLHICLLDLLVNLDFSG